MVHDEPLIGRNFAIHSSIRGKNRNSFLQSMGSLCLNNFFSEWIYYVWKHHILSIAGYAGSMTNAGLNLWYWHQCRSINIKFWINNRILIWHWLVLIGIDLWSSMSCHCIVTWVTWWVIGNCASVQVFNCTWWSYWSTRVTCFPILEACTVGYLNLHRKKIWFTLDRQLFLLTSRESIFLYRFLNWNCGCSDFRKKGMCGELSLSTICGLLSAVSCICHSYSDMVTVCM